jgi:hypothetical protein
MRPLVARRTGQGEQAQEHLATATRMYREMGMTTGWRRRRMNRPLCHNLALAHMNSFA